MAQRGSRKAKACGKLFLGHAHPGAQGLHVNWAGVMHLHPCALSFGMGNGFLQPLFDVLERAFHEFFPFQMLTKISTKHASSLRSALVRLALSPLAKSVSK